MAAALPLRGFLCQHGAVPTGKSEFGEVFLAKAQGLEEGVAETLVLVKSLQSKDEQQQLDFRREFEMFGKLNHANVVRLLALCREAEPHYMVLEYVDLVCYGVGTLTGQCAGGEGVQELGHTEVLAFCDHRQDLPPATCLPGSPVPILPLPTFSFSYLSGDQS